MSYLKVSTLAIELGLTPARVHQLIRKGSLQFFTLVPGGEKYITREEADRFKSLDRKPGRRKMVVNPASIFRPIERNEDSA